MTFIQSVVPDPFIPCRPGWCLMYVRQAFGAPAVEPTATAGWHAAKYRHGDMDFPAGCWVPVWFSLKHEPAGHVALLAPDGSVYSTTSPWGTKATHHPSLSHLFDAYAANNPLTYLGWSEDISGVTVIERKEKDGFLMALTEKQQDDMYWILCTDEGRNELARRVLQYPIKRQGRGAELGGITTPEGVFAWFDNAVIGILESIPSVSPEVVEEFKKKIAELKFSVVSE